MRDKRASEREVATLLGSLALAGGRPDVPCVILDLSAGGARVLVDEALVLPAAFDLHMHSPRQVYRARAKWRNGDELGISFDPPDGSSRTAERQGAAPPRAPSA